MKFNMQMSKWIDQVIFLHSIYFLYFMLAFKEYIKSIETAVVQERVHQFHIVQDTSRMFAFDVSFCTLHEIAKELGNTKYCFISCHADDVVFPHIGSKLGFV